jgi:MFS family permease
VGGGLGWSVLPPLMPGIAKELALSPSAEGLIWGLTAAGIAAASPFGGSAVDRYGPRRVAGIALIAGALACAARALATGPVSLALAMFAFGLHIGFTAPAIPKLLGGHVAPQHLGRANGIALLSYTLGTALTVVTARTMLAPVMGGWRPLMLAAAGAMLLVAVVWLFVAEDRVIYARHASFVDVLRLGGNTQLMLVGAMQFLIFGGYLALLGTLPLALINRGMAITRVGPAVALWLVAAAIANFAGPALSDRIGRRKPILFFGGLVAGVALLGFAFGRPSLGTPMLMLAALGGGCVSPLLLALPLEIPGVGPARAGAALGLLMLVGQIGGFLLPTLAGAVAQHAGFTASLAALAMLHLAVVIPALSIRETGSAGENRAVGGLEVA